MRYLVSDLGSFFIVEVTAMLQFSLTHGSNSDGSNGFDDALGDIRSYERAQRLNETRVPQVGKEPACREG